MQSGILDDVAKRAGATPNAVALAWLPRVAPDVLPIPGTSSVAHLRVNVAVASLDRPAYALAELDRIPG